ncbi:MAG: hypothetical protein CL946_04060 [Ectothiorhodospiraceae bacterium]|nr:hypothetical protein [Ectothiorhodospiraceae bacterium]
MYMVRPVHILHLEDSSNDAELVQLLLAENDIDAKIKLVQTRPEFVDALDNDTFDLILADYKLPAFDGVSAMELAREKAPEIPFIFVSGSIGEEVAIDAMKHGATDYVIKHHINRLVPAVHRALQAQEEQRALLAEKETNKRLGEILQSTSDVVAMADTNGMTTFMNMAGRDLIGIPESEDLTNVHLTEYTPDWANDLISGEGLPTAIRKGHWQGESAIKCRDGRIVPVSQVIIAHKDRHGNLLYFSTVIRDMSEWKEAEKELRTAKERAEESDRLKDNFIAMMSHEIRTPLNVIMGYSNFLRETLEGEVDEDLQMCFTSIDQAGYRLMRTVENILNISSIRVGTYRAKKERVVLHEAVQQLSNQMKRLVADKPVELTFENKGSSPIITVDKYSFEQAITNLVENAIKFTEEGGVVIRSYSQGNLACIDIADTGVGISDEYIPKLFTIFSQEEEGYTRPFEGLGLGLALTKQYMDMNEGKVEVQSEKGAGTTFTLKFQLTGLES